MNDENFTVLLYDRPLPLLLQAINSNCNIHLEQLQRYAFGFTALKDELNSHDLALN